MKYIDADLLKAEIEKRLKNTRDYMNGAGMKYKGPKYHASRGRESAYDAILSFISTLESEKPMDGLEEEIKRWWGEEYMKNSEGLPILPVVQGIARHFAEWQSKQDKETIELAEDHAYLAGSVNEREKMMKDAVEWTVTTNLANRPVIYLDQLKGFQYGDKVRIIIVRE